MADISPNVNNWSATESVNAPQGSAISGAGIDDNLRAIQSGVKKAVAQIGANISAAATVDLSTATGNTISILGTGASISSLGTVAAGAIFTLVFAGANTLVYSANLVLPGGTNISVSAGDVFQFTSRGSGAWTCTGATPNVAPGGLPIGAPIAWLTSTVPTGYLLCAGQVINRTVYSALFAVLGTVYNTGGEAGTDFRLPDMRGRTFAGLDNMGGSAAGRIGTYTAATTVGAVGGSEEPHLHAHTASSANALSTHGHSLASGSVAGTTSTVSTNHYHAVNINSGNENQGHTHNYLDAYTDGAGGLALGAGNTTTEHGRTTDPENQTHYHNISGNTAYQSDSGFGNHTHEHSFSANLSGTSGTADLTHNHTLTVSQQFTGTSGNLQPTLFGNWIIRAY